MFKNELFSDFNIKKLNKYLCKTDCLFLNRLYFWSSNTKSYGVKKEGRVWIYNSLDAWSEQLGISKSSIRRSIKSLRDKKIIDADYLSANKRNRTLYYAINYDAICEYFISIQSSSCAQKTSVSNRLSEHMDEHMYIMDNIKQNINKSYKSKKNKIQKNSEQIIQEKHCVSLRNDKNKIPSTDVLDAERKVTEFNEIEFQKPTIIQDMLKIWKEEFSLSPSAISSSKIELTKNLARFLVAAFKTKFKSCLKEWKKYLKTLKTSIYLMSEKFKLSIWWVIKFITIDRIRAGELGVNDKKIEIDNEELSERLNQHIDNLDEAESCKKLRYKIIEKLSLSTYLSWFTHVNFVENNGKITMKSESQFVEDWINNNFAEQCGLCLQ